jgi:hypothetical protein
MGVSPQELTAMSAPSSTSFSATTEEQQVRAIGSALSAANWSITFEDRRRQARVAHPGASPLQVSLMAATDVVLLVTALPTGSSVTEEELAGLLSPIEPLSDLQRALRVWLSEHETNAPQPAAVPAPDSSPIGKGLLARTTRLGASMGSTLIAATTNLTQKSVGAISEHMPRRRAPTKGLQAAVEGVDAWATRWLAWDSSVTAARSVLEQLCQILEGSTPVALPKQIPVYSGVRAEGLDRQSLSRFPKAMNQWRPHWESLSRSIERSQTLRRAGVNEALAALPLEGNATAPTEEDGLAVFITRLAGLSDDRADAFFEARGAEFPDGKKSPRPDLVMVFSVGNTLEDVLSYMANPQPTTMPYASNEGGLSTPRRSV